MSAGRKGARRAAAAAGFTLVEVVVALLLFAIGAAALAQTLVMAQRLHAGSARWLQAVALAEERLELLHAGARDADHGTRGGLTRRWHAEAVAPGLERLQVTVTWWDRGPQALVLTALRRTEPG